MGGKILLVGIVAAGTMFLILFFLTGPLAYVPNAALAAQGVKLVSARVKQNLSKYFKQAWGAERMETHAKYRYDTLKSAVRAFNNRVVLEQANGPDSN